MLCTRFSHKGFSQGCSVEGNSHKTCSHKGWPCYHYILQDRRCRVLYHHMMSVSKICSVQHCVHIISFGTADC